jgi:hypothetical protein
MVRSVPILAALAVAGCASQEAQVRPQVAPPSQVSEIPADRTAPCRLLGSVEGAHANSGSVAENEADAIEDIRRQVARMGGNAFVVTQRSSGMWRSVVRADAYVCAP